MGEKSDTGHGGKIVINPVLNYISRSMRMGENAEVIIAKAASFFSFDDIIDAKTFSSTRT